ncbi:MAG: isoleucine--tRNA ligase [Candidatus Heimdallarchaeota archaeon]|nr:isoleucine--tRNA ligase [Candidatus Heimdallarchaeota archaeon]
MVEMEEQVLEFWKKNDIFHKRVELNKNSKKYYSFIDGPITANNPMGMHHTWGRSLKDIIQRFWAMRGYDQRYQNGFDCQGLWVEVEVEKALGLDSKKAIEEFGLAEFSAKCKERVNKYSQLLTDQSLRLGQWMHWDNSYYTHTDTNISYIWYFLKTCYQNNWLIKDNLPMPWCTRCGTSLSQHEQHDSYKELKHTSVYVKFPLKSSNSKEDFPEYLLVWTTTPWTLTANTAVAAHPNLTYVKVKQKNEIFYLVKTRMKILKGDYKILEELTGLAFAGRIYYSPFNYLESQSKVKHRVVLWEDVGGEEGTGFVHIAPGCGAEDFNLSKKHKLSVLTPIDEFGIFDQDYNEFEGLSTKEASELAVQVLDNKKLLYLKELYEHRYPTCWRCHEELVFRLVEEWFIDCEEIRPKLKEAAKEVIWEPKFYGKRMQDWLNNMGNWCISRKRYWGLPLPFYECKACGELTVIGSKNELLERAVEGLNSLKELHRPWIDKVKIECPKCGKKVSRIKEVGDCWLDAGIVPFSTLNYLENKEYWEKWFPAQSVCEMREQIRLWFYSLLFMSVTLTGKPPYKKVICHEKVHDQKGLPMHRSWGNAIWFEDAVKEMGADLLRWNSAKQPLAQIMKFGYNLKKELMPFFLTVWNVYSFFATFANLDKFKPDLKEFKKLLEEKEQPLLDRWLLSELNQLIKDVTKYYEKANFRQVTLELEKFVDQLSTWYIRRSRRRFWKNENSSEKASAYYSLYETLMTLTKLLAPITPFFSEILYQNLKSSINDKAPLSIHLCDIPKSQKNLLDKELNIKMDMILELVKLGRSVRSTENLRLRQPLQKVKIWSRNKQDVQIIKEFEQVLLNELNVKKLEIINKPEVLFKLFLKPNYKLLGPKLKGEIELLEKALADIPQKKVLEAFHSKQQTLNIDLKENKKLTLQLNKELVLEAKAKGTLAVAFGSDYAIAFETELTDELVKEGYARDIVRHLQDLRRKQEFAVNDNIIIYYDSNNVLDQVFNQFSEYIQSETLANEIKKTQLEANNYKVKIQGNSLLLKLEQST